MIRTAIFSALVFVFGLLITWLLAFGVLGMGTGDASSLDFWRLATVWALFPAILAAIPARYALLLIGLAAILCGYWLWELSKVTSDGGMGMAIVGIVTFVMIAYALSVVAMRRVFLDKALA